jgi:hypothetical protein
MPIALATVRLIREARFVNGLILGCQWGLLAPTPRLGRVKRSLTPNPKVDRAPQTPKGRILCVVEGLDRCQRRQQRRNCNRADRCSEKHGRSPVINTKGSQSLLDVTTSRI